MFYIRTADRLERTSTWLERIPGGLDHVRDVVVEDSLGICEELESLMTAHVADYRDEWADDHQRPREAAAASCSFVNAPDTPDPVVGFVPERDQIKPDLPLLPSAAPAETPWKEVPSDDPGTRDDPDRRSPHASQLLLRRRLVHGLRPGAC